VRRSRIALTCYPGPVGGINKLALQYLKIEFTPQQRAILDNVSLELIFSVDTAGYAILEDVNGINDKAIIDSLMNRTPYLPPFKPVRIEGHPADGVYTMMLQYPTYSRNVIRTQRVPQTYKKLKREDFETFELGGRMDALVGGMVNGFTGTAHDFLGVGGGMKVDLSFSGKRGYGGGITIGFYGNNRKKDYPIDPLRKQDEAPLTLVIGPVINKTLFRKDRKSVLVQFEPTYNIQSISSRENNQDKDFIQFKGFSPGVTLHNMVMLGKENFSDTYSPALFGHFVNVHAGIRPLFYNSSAGKGIMFEIGLSYRMLYLFMESYILKEF
jgi:hypothetical protein